jgi:hypothetical protein
VKIRQPLLEQIKDDAVKESLQWVVDFISQAALLQPEFKFFDLEFNKAETAVRIPHAMGFTPIDVLVTYTTGGTVTFLYERFTSRDLVITTSGACRVRFFAGKYST